ncbi:hypothetical protein DFH09DRAFT_1076942 [Mycena vulgaris]|nr:hypothetical protein DFH09DRAFT_1076942 [Mycena vulgaris]
MSPGSEGIHAIQLLIRRYEVHCGGTRGDEYHADSHQAGRIGDTEPSPGLHPRILAGSEEGLWERSEGREEAGSHAIPHVWTVKCDVRESSDAQWVKERGGTRGAMQGGYGACMVGAAVCPDGLGVYRHDFRPPHFRLRKPRPRYATIPPSPSCSVIAARALLRIQTPMQTARPRSKKPKSSRIPDASIGRICVYCAWGRGAAGCRGIETRGSGGTCAGMGRDWSGARGWGLAKVRRDVHYGRVLRKTSMGAGPLPPHPCQVCPRSSLCIRARLSDPTPHASTTVHIHDAGYGLPKLGVRRTQTPGQITRGGMMKRAESGRTTRGIDKDGGRRRDVRERTAQGAQR